MDHLTEFGFWFYERAKIKFSKLIFSIVTFNPFLSKDYQNQNRLPNWSITVKQSCYKITSLSQFSGKTNARNFQLKFRKDKPQTLTATFYFTSEINSHGILNDGWMEGNIISAIIYVIFLSIKIKQFPEYLKVMYLSLN